MQRLKTIQTYCIAGFRNESGVVLVTSLLIMVVLAIMGAASLAIRNTEQSITTNSEVFQHNFYAVEATTMEGAAEINELSDTVLSDSTAFPGWLKEDDTTIDLTQSSQWPSGLISPSETNLTGTVIDVTPGGYASDGTTAGDRIWYAATDLGICGGSSVTNPTQTERCYDVYGMYDVKQGAGKAYHGRMMLNVGLKSVVYATP